MSNDDPERLIRRYAADFARLYAKAREDEEGLRELNAGLLELAEAQVHLARSLTLEEACARLAELAHEVVGFSAVGVYVVEGPRSRLTAQLHQPGLPKVLGVGAADLQGETMPLDAASGAPWEELSGLGASTLVPLQGRRAPIGFLVAAGEGGKLGRRASSHASLLALFTRSAGLALENHQLERRRAPPPATPEPASGADVWQALAGGSGAFTKQLQLLRRLAGVDSPVLLLGETGTGKSMVARLLHQASSRAAAPFVSVNCAALPESLVESELFGHEAGAFTGARGRRKGRIEQAHGGTLFLDEIGDLSLVTQSKLLTVLEERRFVRVGGEREVAVDVRLVSATNQDLEAAVAEGRFRSDLLYRINVFTVNLPPLRERGADVVGIARATIDEVARRYDLPAPSLAPEAEARLLAYEWPGNVRELRNVIEKAVVLSDGDIIGPELLPGGSAAPRPAAAAPAGAPAREAAAAAPPPARDEATPAWADDLSFAEAKAKMNEQWEMGYVAALLRGCGGNLASAARRAKVDKKHLHRKVKQYGIELDEIRRTAQSS